MTANPIQVALVITELEIGGAERCLAQLALGLDRRHFAPVVYSLASPPDPPKDGLVRALDEGGVPVQMLGFRRRWQLPAAVRRLRQLLKQQRAGVVQSFLFHANVVTALAAGKLAPPAVSLGVRVADPSAWRQQVERYVSRRAARVVCVSQSIDRYVAKRLAVANEKRLVIPNGVDISRLVGCRPAELASLGVPAGRRVLVCIARLARQKGVDLLLRAAPQLLDKLPCHQLVLVGDGPQAGELRQLANRLKLSNRVHFVGWRPNVAEILRASDLMILPSRWEGMPNVLLEAMGCARPVVCTEADGVLEVLGPLARAQTVPINNPEVLVQKVLNVLSNPQAAKRLGEENQRRVADQFSLQAMIQRYEQLFQELSSASEIR